MPEGWVGPWSVLRFWVRAGWSFGDSSGWSIAVGVDAFGRSSGGWWRSRIGCWSRDRVRLNRSGWPAADPPDAHSGEGQPAGGVDGEFEPLEVPVAAAGLVGDDLVEDGGQLGSAVVERLLG